MPTITVHISRSTDPRMDLARYPLFADVRVGARQITTKRGNRAEIDAFVAQVTEQAASFAHPVAITDESN